MLQTWLNVLMHPGEAAFANARQDADANLSTALLWMAICAAIGASITILLGGSTQSIDGAQGLLALVLPADFLHQFSNSFLDQTVAPNTTGTLLVGVVFVLIVSVIAFLVGVGIQFLIAKLFGGTGAYGRYAYLIAAFAAPLTILSSLSELVPLLGGPISLAIFIYQLILTYFATKVEHNLTRGKTIGVVLAPLVLLAIAVGCAAIASGGGLSSLMGNQ